MGRYELGEDPVYWCIYRFCMQPCKRVLRGQASASLGWPHPFLRYPPPPQLPHLQRFTWVYSRGHIDTGNHNVEREQIIERKMKAKYISEEMISSWSDNWARGPARPPGPWAETSIPKHLSIDTSCLTTESHETHHDLFFFLQRLVSTLFWTVGLHLYHSWKKSKIENTIKYFCR